ncbi:kinase-like protein [Amniculicola lignicola CBS 123094]|uniref:Kinase-like protein n=1 Tax=Amniculicola lignicola CBS 123094 TaxID=1392246 RepID=A0A6A5WQS4_9PLEO|nr:kinase-like protein [Amniculicola lignicola CBS 123094]
MAPTSESSHTFQKLKLDISTPYKPVASGFASISREHLPQDAPVGASPDSAALSANGLSYLNGGGKHRQAEACTNGRHAAPRNGSVPNATPSSDNVEAKFRHRTTSISFDREVTLDSGNRVSVEQPLPRSFNSTEVLSETSNGGSYSDEDQTETPLQRHKRLQHHVGESRYPLLQSTVDELAGDSEYSDQVASLTSEATASPPLDEVRTPSDFVLSPLAATSPIEFPLFPNRRNGSTRTRAYRADLAEGDGVGSLRRTSRRSSTRSGLSMPSMSPAASFLARYKVADGPVKPTEPDDEGQGFGYRGEYIIGKQLGFGGFSIVKEVTTINDKGERVTNAVKIVRKQLNGRSELENDQLQTQFDHEVEIWRYLKHPYILPLYSVYSTEFATFCITRLNKGGTLFDLVRDTRRKKKKGLPAHLAKRYAYQLASAMRYLHNDVMIVHRDIKLENCLLDMTVPNAEVDGGNVLLCDFGMADFIVSDHRDGPEPHSVGPNPNIGPADTSTSVAGSLQYAAPELFNAQGPVFSTAADIWAFGVVIYALLIARLPFDDGMDARTMNKIREGDWDADIIREAEGLQEGGVDEALDLLKGCLDLNPERRWAVNDILSCSWLSGCSRLYEHTNHSWLANA